MQKSLVKLVAISSLSLSSVIYGCSQDPYRVCQPALSKMVADIKRIDDEARKRGTPWSIGVTVEGADRSQIECFQRGIAEKTQNVYEFRATGIPNEYQIVKNTI